MRGKGGGGSLPPINPGARPAATPTRGEGPVFVAPARTLGLRKPGNLSERVYEVCRTKPRKLELLTYGRLVRRLCVRRPGDPVPGRGSAGLTLPPCHGAVPRGKRLTLYLSTP